MDGMRWGADHQILDLVHESIYERDRDRRITFWNAAAQSLYGWTREEALGRDVVELLHCDFPQSIDECEKSLFASGLWQGEISRRTKDGSEILVDVNWAVRRSEDGEAIAIIETGRDVTDRKAMEEARLQTERRFRNLFDVMAVAFWEIDFNDVGAQLISLLDTDGGDLRSRLLADRATVRRLMKQAIVLDVNAKTIELFGATEKSQIVGRDIEPYWPADSEPVFVDALVATMDRQPHFIAETVLLDLSNRPLDLLFTVSWSPESRREGVVLLGVVDIGDRKRAFEAVEQSEHRYRSIFDRMPMAFWQLETGDLRAEFEQLRADGIIDLEDYAGRCPDFVSAALDLVQVTDVNQETIRMMGAKEKAELLGPMSRTWQDKEGFVRSIDARFRGQPSFSDISKVRTLDGRDIDVLWTTAFSDELAAGGSVLTGAIDITERRKSAEAISRSEAKYRNLFHHLPVSLWQLNSDRLIAELGALRVAGMVDLDAYIDAHPDFLSSAMQWIQVEEVNERTVRMFGGSEKSEFVGPIGRYWENNPDAIRRSLCARWNGDVSYQEETKVRTLDGRLIDIFFTSAFPPALADQGITIVAAIDIGDRVKAEAAVARLEGEFAHAARIATLGELTASIAHEVNQPLAAIATNGEASLRWLDRPEPNISEVRQLSSRIVADARRAAEVISNIRKMASPAEPQREIIEINALIEEAIGFLRRELLHHGVRHRLNYGNDLPSIRGDRTQLQQVLVNLSINACHAMQGQPNEHRSLVIRTSEHGRGVRVEVEDTGAGIDESVKSRLFESFFSTKKDGLGIGLPICRSIIESHGGTLSAENTGSGARFAFELPALQSDV